MFPPLPERLPARDLGEKQRKEGKTRNGIVRKKNKKKKTFAVAHRCSRTHVVGAQPCMRRSKDLDRVIYKYVIVFLYD